MKDPYLLLKKNLQDRCRRTAQRAADKLYATALRAIGKMDFTELILHVTMTEPAPLLALQRDIEKLSPDQEEKSTGAGFSLNKGLGLVPESPMGKLWKILLKEVLMDGLEEMAYITKYFLFRYHMM